MAKRILVPIVPDVTADYTPAAISAARIARKTGGVIRLACLMPLPPPRVDDQDRVARWSNPDPSSTTCFEPGTTIAPVSGQ